MIGNALYIFGGGSAASSSAVQRFDLATRTAAIVAHLPRPLSDVAAATTPDGVYLIGGYDGRTPQRAIYRTRDGTHVARVATLPVGLRYAAVAAVGDLVVIAGGDSAAGTSDQVYLLDTAKNALASLGALPVGTAGAETFALGGDVYVGGGTDRAGAVVGTIYRIDPAARTIVRVAGSLPVRNAATVVLGRTAWVIGGATSAGTSALVWRVGVRG
jgi:N-acetylneuraminic acid mutarotase